MAKKVQPNDGIILVQEGTMGGPKTYLVDAKSGRAIRNSSGYMDTRTVNECGPYVERAVKEVPTLFSADSDKKYESKFIPKEILTVDDFNRIYEISKKLKEFIMTKMEM
jgi:hypothetical protein